MAGMNSHDRWPAGPAVETGRLGWAGKIGLVLKTLQARLRFVVVVAAIGGVLAYWDTLRAHYEKWTRPLARQESAAPADTEYWCPHHPTIVRDHADNCPICGMPLSRRSKTEGSAAAAWRPGVVSRVQESPFRVVQAGIQTVEVGYQSLTRDITTVGSVEFDERLLRRISWRVSGQPSRIEEQFVNFTDQPVRRGEPLARVYSPDLVVTVQTLLDARRTGNPDLERSSRERLRLWGIDPGQLRSIEETGKPITYLTIRSPQSGHVIRKYQREGDYVQEGAQMYEVADLSTVWIQAQVFEEDIPFLKEGLEATASTHAFPNRQFRGKLAFVHPHLDSSTRTLKVRYDVDNPRHELRPGMYVNVTLHVPLTALNMLAADAAEEQRRAYQKGLVLAVPERAVIDTGTRSIVYREAEPDVYEGVEVQLGPRSGGFYPVLGVLKAGEKVATSGSFLIDADTRLSAGAGSTYFGATGGPQGERPGSTTVRPSTRRSEDERVSAALTGLSSEDRRLVLAQAYCPNTGNRLGTMGKPIRLALRGEPVFVCCQGCVEEVQARPEETLKKVAELKAKQEKASKSLN
jgi:hypothetical protein